jgi:hypothetical protein
VANPLSSVANALKTCCERNACDDTVGVLKAVFPHADDAPAGFAQLTIHEPVASDACRAIALAKGGFPCCVEPG